MSAGPHCLFAGPELTSWLTVGKCPVPVLVTERQAVVLKLGLALKDAGLVSFDSCAVDSWSKRLTDVHLHTKAPLSDSSYLTWHSVVFEEDGSFVMHRLVAAKKRVTQAAIKSSGNQHLVPLSLLGDSMTLLPRIPAHWPRLSCTWLHSWVNPSCR